jgi:hypothetical protein
VDFAHLDEVGSADNSTYRVERSWMSRAVCSVPKARSAANDDDAWPMRPFHFAMGRAA